MYVTGALPSTATFPSPSTLSSYQHTGAYPSRSYATNPSLALPDPAFSTSTNGLFPHHDPLLHLKSSQAVLPTALAFNHLSSSTLGAALPVQSSTYRSAQESAPHLLQPQFSLLPPTLPAAHGVTQPYGAAVFSGSIERALQRECSVIKHHQRPSASIATSEQLPSSEQPLHGYFSPGSDVDVSYHQEPSRQNATSCGSTTGANGSSQGACHAPQPKTDSAVCPPASLPDVKACPTKLGPLPAAATEGHSHSLEQASGSPERYPSAAQKQNSVIANQQPTQLSSLMASSVSQSYITPCTQSVTSRAAADRLPPLYKAMSSLSSQPDSVTAATQTLYSSSSGLSHEHELQYRAQAQGLCQGSLSETYSVSHPQGPANVSFTSQSEGSAPVSQHHSYTRGQPLNQALDSSYPTTCVHSQPVVQNYALTQASMAGKPHDTPSQMQTRQHKFVLAPPLPTYTSATQALQNNGKPLYSKQKVGEHVSQERDAQKHTSTTDSTGMSAQNDVIFVVSKVDEQPKAPSVIRSNSRSDEPFMLLPHENVQQFKSERMVPIGQQSFPLSSTNDQDAAADVVNSNVPLSPGQRKQQQHILQLKSPEPHEHQSPGQPHSLTSSAHTQFITVPSAQVLLDHNQMILVQPPLAHPAQNSSKAAQSIQPVQDLGSVQVQYLTMDRELLGPGVGVTQSQQGTIVSEPNLVCADSSKHHTFSQSANQQPENTKNHFSLNSICFPDSMLLADDRSILSNVDDILAATVAACGVAPQDLVKAVSTAEAEMAIMASPVDSKSHFQTVDIRHMSPSFSPAQHPIMSNTNSHSMTLNGVQMAADCHHHGNNGPELEAHGNGGSTEEEYCLAGQASYEPSHLQNRIKGNAKCVKTEDGFAECQGSDDFPKKKVRSKPHIKGPEEDSRQAKAAKRCGPTKRQNSKGGDARSPTPPPSTFDGCPQQERIRQKIREVEEKQPEVKTGFIGSFLDFIKSGPKHQYSPGPARTFSRQKKPCSSTRPAPLALVTPPPRVQNLAELSRPQHHQQAPGLNTQQKRLEEDFQKNLETLPSFSSDEEENTGRNQALRNSISSALSALDESADRKVKTGRDTFGKILFLFLSWLMQCSVVRL